MAAAVAPHSWAPIEQAPPKGHPLLREATQGDLAHQQTLQRTQCEVGFVPLKSNESPEVPAEVSDHSAGSNLVSAQNQTERQDSERAKKVLQNAEVQIENQQSSGTTNWLWGLIFGVFGFGSIMGLRTWAAKNIPMMPTSAKPASEDPTKPKKQTW